MYFSIIASSFLLSFAAAQSCPPAGQKESCLNNVCSAGSTCVDVGLPTEICCDNALLPVTVSTTRATSTTKYATTSSGCVDLLNPRTGISDCPTRANLCNDSVYYDVMTRQCPRTCNRCSSNSVATSSDCVDGINPKTGVSDCPMRANLCKNSMYKKVMALQCPRTCGLCQATTTSTSTKGRTCVDKINPKTGVSDCPRMAAFCNSSLYKKLMTEECPATCGKC